MVIFHVAGAKVARSEVVKKLPTLPSGLRLVAAHHAHDVKGPIKIDESKPVLLQPSWKIHFNPRRHCLKALGLVWR